MNLTSLIPLLPEIVVALGAMALLMIGAVLEPQPKLQPHAPAPPYGSPKLASRDPARHNARQGELIGWLAILVFAAALYLVAVTPGRTVTLFDRAFISDGFARFMKVLILIGAGASLMLSFDELKRNKVMQFEYPVLVMLATVGMMVMVSAGDLISLYLGIELQSLALYVLAASRRDDVKSSEAGLKYFVLGALSSGMLLYGASLIYGFTGATEFSQIARVAESPGAAQNIGLIAGLVFLMVGLAFKISAVPFHMWTPDVYEGAPTPVTAFFAAVPKLAAMALFTRVLSTGFPGIGIKWQQIVVFLSIASMLLGAFGAIGQNNIKRLLAYSSIGNIGFALVGLAANSDDGIQGVLIYLALYLAMTLGAFAAVLAMRRKSGPVEEISELAGLAQTNPSKAFILAALMLSLAGIPPLIGFFAKFYVFNAAVKAGMWPLAIIGVVASVIGAYYYLRIVKLMYFDAAKPAFAHVDRSVFIVMAACGLFVILATFVPGPLVDAAASAAHSLRP